MNLGLACAMTAPPAGGPAAGGPGGGPAGGPPAGGAPAGGWLLACGICRGPVVYGGGID